MDISSNVFDYMYLVNPNRLDRIRQKKENTIILNEEIHFYRKRIFSLTKNYLKGKSRDRDLDKMWEIYAKACVDYFKFIDKSELIQATYMDIKVKKKKNIIDKNAVTKSNEFMLNKKKPHAPRITDHIKVTSTKTNIKTNKKMVIPRERKLNLKSDHFKNKI
jgi:hypothetical protein